MKKIDRIAETTFIILLICSVGAILGAPGDVSALSRVFIRWGLALIWADIDVIFNLEEII